MEIYYQNCKGQKVYLDREPFRMLSDTNLFNYEWLYETKRNNRVKSIKKSTRTATVNVFVEGRNRAEYEQNAKHFYEVVDYDCVMGESGRLHCGDYFLQCYFFRSEKAQDYVNGKEIAFTIVTDNVDWIREKQYLIKPYMEGVSETTGGDYEFDYPMDYARELPTKRIVNDGIAPVNFEMIIYGPCESPAVTIGENLYKVNISLVAGEYLKINSIIKKAYKVKTNGEQISVFHYRERGHELFEKIVPGINDVSWDGTFGFDITILEERSEPKWI